MRRTSNQVDTRRRYGHQCLAHRPTGPDTQELYVELLEERLDLSPWECWQVAIEEAAMNRKALYGYLTRQTNRRGLDPEDYAAWRTIMSRAGRVWTIQNTDLSEVVLLDLPEEER